MPKHTSDFIDRSIETMFARGYVQRQSEQTSDATLPRMNLATPVENQRPIRNAISSNSSRGQNSNGNESKSDERTSNVIETATGSVWLSGNVVMCACPDCQAPVSVRLWLMVADCWSCETAIELDYEQQQAARELANRVQPEPPRRIKSAAVTPSAISQPDEEAVIESVTDIDTDIERRRLVQILRRSTNMFPAWLISMLVHMVLILLLALFLLPKNEEVPMITLSTVVAPMDRVGGINVDAPEELELEFDHPIPEKYKRSIDRKLEKVRIAADQDARELMIDPDPNVELPEFGMVSKTVRVRQGSTYTAMRDPQKRNEIVKREGGTTLSEAAVSRGLRFLDSVQNLDGSWSRNGYRNHDREGNEGDAGGTSLALLAFLGAGQTHETGRYKKTVSSGLKWLIDHQRADGALRFGIEQEAGIYAHAIATIVLIEALAMTGDETFRVPAQKALDFIQDSQHKHGGWRYYSRRRGERRISTAKLISKQPGDTSVAGWQLMALQSARGSKTGLRVDDATLLLVDQFLDLVSLPYETDRYDTAPAGTLYRYLPGEPNPKPSMTAEGILCRMYLGWKRDDPRMRYSVNWLLKNALPELDSEKEMNLYYCYYATQVMHHYGGDAWETWNRHLRDSLIIRQETGEGDEEFPGSWNHKQFSYGKSGGRIYTTALAICTLEVYYRHLPLFKQLELE